MNGYATAAYRRRSSQLYDPLRQMFLPDRYSRVMPESDTPDQYGDNCEIACGVLTADLKNPRSVVSGARRNFGFG